MVGAYFWTACHPVELDSNYARGFEDGIQLCYAKVTEAKTLEEAKATIEGIWGKVTSRKVWIIEQKIPEIWGD